MPASSRPSSQTQRLLSAAISPLLHPHKPAETCPNLHKPASPDQNSQIEPTAIAAPLDLPDFIRATYPKTDAEVRQFIATLRSSPAATPNPPAQTCTNLPKSASPPQKSQFEPKCHPDTPSPSSPPLPPRQLLAARLLLQGHTAKAVAARLKVNPHTITEWKKRPAFRSEIQRLLNQNPRHPPQ